jgi:hypothetical protein
MQLLKEQREHQDIVFLDIEDSYQNSAAKMLAFYRAVFESRLKYEALVKMDDDGAIIPRAFLEGMESPAADIDGIVRPERSSTLRAELQRAGPRWLGNFRSQQQAFTDAKTTRNAKAAKWKGGVNEVWRISHKLWPWPLYPSFAAGTLHIMNWEYAHWLGLRAQTLPTAVWMEDVAHALWFDQAATESPAMA